MYKIADALVGIFLIVFLVAAFASIPIIVYYGTKHDRINRCEEYKMCLKKENMTQFDCMYYTKVNANEVVECVEE